MTLRQAIDAVRACGLQLKWDRDLGEYTVRIPGRPAADYFTDDREDAVATARAMATQLAMFATFATMPAVRVVCNNRLFNGR